MVIPSTLDDTLAPQVRRSRPLCQRSAAVARRHLMERSREQVAELISIRWNVTRGFKAVSSAAGRAHAISRAIQADRRRRIFHGAMTLDQLFWARPALGYAGYRSRSRTLSLRIGRSSRRRRAGAPGHGPKRYLRTGNGDADRGMTPGIRHAGSVAARCMQRIFRFCDPGRFLGGQLALPRLPALKGAHNATRRRCAESITACWETLSPARVIEIHPPLGAS